MQLETSTQTATQPGQITADGTASSEPTLLDTLSSEEVLQQLRLWPLRFNQLAHEPYAGTRPLTQADVERVRCQLPRFVPLRQARGVRSEDVAQALSLAALERPYHPVAELVSGLQWDGAPRLVRVAQEILGVDASDEALASALLRHWFRSAVARAFQPGLSSDSMLVLVGRTPAGTEPELFFRTLTPRQFYLDAPAGLGLQGFARHARRAWIVFRNDLPALSPISAARLVSELQETEDPVDGICARSGERAPRTTLFVAAVDELPAVRNEAFRRCLLPIPLRGTIDLVKLLEWRDQLWAEAAVSLVEQPCTTLDPTEELSVRRLQSCATESDPWEGRVLNAVARFIEPKRPFYLPDGPTMFQIQEAMGLPTGKQSSPLQRRIARILEANGFCRHRPHKAPYTTTWARGDVARVADAAHVADGGAE